MTSYSSTANKITYHCLVIEAGQVTCSPLSLRCIAMEMAKRIFIYAFSISRI